MLSLNWVTPLRAEATQRRSDSRALIVQRRERTRHLIELGGLVQKAGLVELTEAHDVFAVQFGISP